MKRIRVAVTYPPADTHPMHRRLMAGGPVSRADLLMWGPVSTVTSLTWFDAGREAAADLLAGVESVTASHLVAGDDGTYAFVHQSEYELDERVLDLVADARVVFLPPVSFRESGRVTVEAVGESVFLSEFYEALAAAYDAEIEQVREFRRGPAPSDVTDRQRAALETAVELGYYDVPRTAGVADVARELDCARSTAGELLRKAESAAVAAFASP